MILCIYKVHERTVFFKGIYTSGNSRTRRTGSPEHPKENNRLQAYMRWYYACNYMEVHACIFQRNPYFRELTYRRTASPEHPKENTRLYAGPWDNVMHI